MIIDFAALSPSRIYFTMTQTLLPRPIAWVLSDNGDESVNLAPFSYFNGVCSEPPLIMLSIGKKMDGTLKDTRKNILERKHFVVHIAHGEMAEAVTASSTELDFADSEQKKLHLPLAEFPDFSLPRLADCRIAYACEYYQHLELGELPQAMILGRVKAVYIDDAIATLDEKNRLQVDAKKLNPLARLGPDTYATLAESFQIKLKLL